MRAMRTPHNYKRHRAICTALRTMRSALCALALVWLPSMIHFLQAGSFTRADLLELARSLSIAALIVLFNFVQKYRERELSPRRRTDRRRLARKQSPTSGVDDSERSPRQ